MRQQLAERTRLWNLDFRRIGCANGTAPGRSLEFGRERIDEFRARRAMRRVAHLAHRVAEARMCGVRGQGAAQKPQG
jgi:hypothetical protein